MIMKQSLRVSHFGLSITILHSNTTFVNKLTLARFLWDIIVIYQTHKNGLEHRCSHLFIISRNGISVMEHTKHSKPSHSGALYLIWPKQLAPLSPPLCNKHIYYFFVLYSGNTLRRQFVMFLLTRALMV